MSNDLPLLTIRASGWDLTIDPRGNLWPQAPDPADPVDKAEVRRIVTEHRADVQRQLRAETNAVCPICREAKWVYHPEYGWWCDSCKDGWQ